MVVTMPKGMKKKHLPKNMSGLSKTIFLAKRREETESDLIAAIRTGETQPNLLQRNGL